MPTRTLNDIGALAAGNVLRDYLQPVVRTQDLRAAAGYFAASPPDLSSSGAAVAATQTVYGGAVYLYAGEVVTNVNVCVTTAAAGTAPTGLYLGVWDSGTPTCLAATANLASDGRWTSTGWKANALSAPLTIGTTGVYYLALLENGVFGTTPIQFASANATAALGGPIGSGARLWCSLKTSATAMAASDTGTFAAVASVPVMAAS